VIFLISINVFRVFRIFPHFQHCAPPVGTAIKNHHAGILFNNLPCFGVCIGFHLKTLVQLHLAPNAIIVSLQEVQPMSSSVLGE
jgi:hypothetical protein